MARIQWPLHQGRPCVKVVLEMLLGGRFLTRTLLADTGAGSSRSGFDLLLDEDDCLICGGGVHRPVTLGGAFPGRFPTYVVRVSVPALNFVRSVRAVGIPSPPAGFDGIACFSFLNRFTYGNFGNPDEFGLEC